jgi:tRNA pseudouridine65 synthase
LADNSSPPLAVSVLYRDEFLLAVDKPSGMLVHRGWGRDRVVLVDVVREMLDLEAVHPLHRLDRQTSGVVLFALTPGVARALSRELEAGRVEKRYLTLVRGVTNEAGTIDYAIPRTENGPRVHAVTEYERLALLAITPRHLSWLSVRPRTGRLHQVRRHLKHISHPVIGDANYGKGPLNRAVRERYGLCRMALHAASLSFIHPKTAKAVVICSTLPDDLSVPLNRMGLGLDAEDDTAGGDGCAI